MKILVAFCFVAAVAQAIDVDWTTVDTMHVVPKYVPDLKKIFGNQTPENSRIVGGEEATPGQFPYQVALLVTIPGGTGFCGGSILNEEWVLTAAHCVDTASEAILIIGAHNVVDGDPDQIRVPVRTIIVHTDWDRSGTTNDIALLGLDEKLQFNDRVQPIRLPSRSQTNTSFADETAIVSGWGKDSDSATSVSSVLRWTYNNVMGNGVCTFFFVGGIVDSQICLSGTGGRSACNGDSGGPMVVEESDGLYTQIGMVSYGIVFGCAIGWPGVYTRITSYLDWIEINSSVFIRN